MNPLVVDIASPVLLPTENPLKVGATALPVLVIKIIHDPSLAGAVIVKAPLSVMNCNGL